MSRTTVVTARRHSRTLAACGAMALAATALAACDGGDASRGGADGDSAAVAARGESARVAASRETSCGASGAAGDTGVRVIPVNRGTHGMAARVKWVASPDRCALLVVEDPAAVEAEPVPNGAVLVSEVPGVAAVVSIDSVWDVAPSADFTRLAYGRAYGLSHGESDTIPPAKWNALARRVGVDARTLAQASWPSSGMAYARAVAVAHVLDARLPTGSRRDSSAGSGAGPVSRGEPTTAPRRVGFGGWRAGWRGDTAYFGDRPRGAQDFSPATVWRRLVPGATAVVDVPPATAPDSTRWTEGPLIDISNTVDLQAGKVIEAGRATVEGRDGMIVLRRATGSERTVGPGMPLAATLGGRFIVALAPAPDAGEFDPKVRLVVYEVRD